ncbi:MAG: DUF3540 domain-containing protein, partial [Thermodesulfobacteriota bacterium]
NLLSAGPTRLTSSETHITGGQVSVNADKLTARARELEAHGQSLRVFADAIDTVAKRLSQRVNILMRWVEDLETLNIGHLVQTVRRTLVSHSHQAVITAKADMRIDGERIHLG